MKKSDLLKRIEELEQEIAQLRLIVAQKADKNFIGKPPPPWKIGDAPGFVPSPRLPYITWNDNKISFEPPSAVGWMYATGVDEVVLT